MFSEVGFNKSLFSNVLSFQFIFFKKRYNLKKIIGFDISSFFDIFVLKVVTRFCVRFFQFLITFINFLYFIYNLKLSSCFFKGLFFFFLSSFFISFIPTIFLPNVFNFVQLISDKTIFCSFVIPFCLFRRILFQSEIEGRKLSSHTFSHTLMRSRSHW